jgi:methionyl-tRNA formyltransferase
MRVLFCAYRDWAKSVYDDVKNLCTESLLVTTPEQLSTMSRQTWDVIIVVGWSWKIEEIIVKENLVIGMHPSDLPDYAGGSPIQNQVLDGLIESRATLFRLNEKFDEGEILDKERIDLTGHLDDIFCSIQSATTTMIKRFMSSYPDISLHPQASGGKKVRRLKPEDSMLPNTAFPAKLGGKKMSCLEMWNFIRCREDPYPNVFFEDETGKLVIKHVEFTPKDNPDS